MTLADGQHIASACVLWAAGVMASPAAKWLDAPADRAGRVIVDDDLSVPGHPDIFVIGDTASVTGERRPAGAGHRAGRQADGPLRRRADQGAARRQAASKPFRYPDYGNLATIGRKAAVADFGRFRLSGFPAWLLWSFAHLWFLVGFRNRIVVFLDWTWAYATFDRGARLITEPRQLSLTPAARRFRSAGR